MKLGLALALAKQQKALRLPPVELLDYQKPPKNPPFIIMYCCGRGAGKTFTGKEYAINHLRQYGAGANVGYLAASIPAAIGTNMYGKDGLFTWYGENADGTPGLYGNEFTYINQTRKSAKHKGGGTIRFFGADEKMVEGPSLTLLVIDEIWKIPESVWNSFLLTVRDEPAPGVEPLIVICTTPKFSSLVQKISKMPDCRVINVETKQNTHLSKKAVRIFYQTFENTPLADSELYGKICTQLPNAYWQMDNINRDRVNLDDVKGSFIHIVVALDPEKDQATGKSRAEEKSATGFAVCAKDAKGHGYLVDSKIGNYRPDQWAQLVVDLCRVNGTREVVPEVNQGGEMVVQTLHAVDPTLIVNKVVATQAKEVRAQPIALMAFQGRIHHCGYFDDLEPKMCTFPMNIGKVQIDDIEAMVWGFTKLFENTLQLIAPTHTTEEIEQFLKDNPDVAADLDALDKDMKDIMADELKEASNG